MPEASLAESYEYCRKVARAAARNFYYGFRLLPHAKRDALCALYAFMRQVDDISDSPGGIAQKKRALAQRRALMDRVLSGEAHSYPLWPAFRHTISRYQIPARYLHDLISGAEMDLCVGSYETFDRLREYCYRVAGTVGLCCAHVFAFSDPAALEAAEKLGIAFQLTNILRDVPGDLKMGRVYLPQQELQEFGCSAGDLENQSASEALRGFIRFQAERAWGFYREGARLLELVDADSRAALWALARIYCGILEKIEARGYDILSPPPPRLSSAEKIWILARARLGWRGQTHVFANHNRGGRRTGGTFLRRRVG